MRYAFRTSNSVCQNATAKNNSSDTKYEAIEFNCFAAKKCVYFVCWTREIDYGSIHSNRCTSFSHFYYGNVCPKHFIWKSQFKMIKWLLFIESSRSRFECMLSNIFPIDDLERKKEINRRVDTLSERYGMRCAARSGCASARDRCIWNGIYY